MCKVLYYITYMITYHAIKYVYLTTNRLCKINGSMSILYFYNLYYSLISCTYFVLNSNIRR